MYIDSFLRYLTNEKRYSVHTIRSYKSDLEQFTAFGIQTDSEFNPLTSDHKIIRKWIIFLLENGNTPRSANRKITTLKSFYKFQYRNGDIETIPTDKVVLPKMSKPLPHFVSKSTMDILFDQFEFPDDFIGLRDRTIMLMFYCTGMRLSELVNLTINNIDLNSGQLKVLGKRNKERIIPFDAELKMAIQKYISQRSSFNCNHNILYITSEGNPVYDKLVYRVVNKYLSTVTTLEKRSPHILRHTFATQMLNSGADINAIKELLGHANLSATQIYTHTTFEKLKQIYNQAHPRA
ncbi:MAG: tyrosine-type recombinase/integrase [Salinivirgaceae bacterium]|jgi:integrase/recombinase XerC|nr:tyrosine-type recombinase/integrase [Salinivirgaceae bacterium]